MKTHKPHFFLKSFLCSFLALLLATSPVSAISDELWDFYGINGIYYYDPEGNTSSACYNGTINIAGSTAAEKIWTGLTGFMSEEQAAGVLGNMRHEGGLNPLKHEYSFVNKHYLENGFDLLNDDSVSYGVGLIQWSGGRRVNLFRYIQEKAPDLIDFFLHPKLYNNLTDTQLIDAIGESTYDSLIKIELEFLQYELQTYSSYKGIFNQNTVEESADFFLRHVEIPGDIAGQVGIRLASAQEFYNQLSGSTFTSTGGVCGGGNGDINATALALAWPEHGHSMYEPTEAYAAALVATGVNKLGDEWSMMGASCDAFVATVMRYSGADPEYVCCLVSELRKYMANHPEKYVLVTGNIFSSDDVMEGDILVANSLKHIEIAVRKEDGTMAIASASHGERTGEVGNWYHNDGTYQAWRFIGEMPRGEEETPPNIDEVEQY